MSHRLILFSFSSSSSSASTLVWKMHTISNVIILFLFAFVVVKSWKEDSIHISVSAFTTESTSNLNRHRIIQNGKRCNRLTTHIVTAAQNSKLTTTAATTTTRTTTTTTRTLFSIVHPQREVDTTSLPALWQSSRSSSSQTTSYYLPIGRRYDSYETKRRYTDFVNYNDDNADDNAATGANKDIEHEDYTDAVECYLENGENNKNNKFVSNSQGDYDNDDCYPDVLAYLPTSIRQSHIPPLTKTLLKQATLIYVRGRNQNNNKTSKIPILSLSDISNLIETEYITRDVPVYFHHVKEHDTITNSNKYFINENINNNDSNIKAIADVTASGHETDELIAEILSLFAIYRIPQVITSEFLQYISHTIRTSERMNTPNKSSSSSSSNGNNKNNNNNNFNNINTTNLQNCVDAFTYYGGWEAVSFPQGLALIRPKNKLYQTEWNTEQPTPIFAQIFPPRRRQRRKNHLIQRGQDAIAHAINTRPPQRRLLSKQEFLATMEAQIRGLDVSIPSSNSDSIASAVMATTTTASTTLPSQNLRYSGDSMQLIGDATRSQSLLSSVASPSSSSPSSLDNTIAFSGMVGSSDTIRFGPPMGKLFFPNSVQPISGIRMSFRRLKRFLKRQYSTLKEHGRAGFLAYCFFNFVYYSIGMVWQWRHISTTTPTDPTMILNSSASLASSILSSSSSGFASSSNTVILTMCLIKFGKVFAYVLTLSQLFKIPKLVSSVAIAPFTSKLLQWTKQKFQTSDNIATIGWTCCLVLLWICIVSIPIVTEYTNLVHLVRFDEELVQLYGNLQTV
jgi:hypothetical protein